MSPSGEDDDIGYKRPPKRTRCRPGQSGNPRRRYSARELPSPIELIDQLLLDKIEITENGVSRLATKLEAILLQLWRKELDGNLKALTIRLKYQDIANQYAADGLKITFADSDYTRALATELKQRGPGNE